MCERMYTVRLGGKTGKVMPQELAALRAWYIRDCELGTRMSELIWVDIFFLERWFRISPYEIMNAIKQVEEGEPSSLGVKAATQFKYPPLKGLWHKHYFSAQFLPKNIQSGLGGTKLMDILEEVMDPAKSPVFTEQMASEIVQRVTLGTLGARNESRNLTGEWIIFLRRSGKNYYLCCNTHASGDQFIYDRIMEHCVCDFPELPIWMKELNSTASSP